MALPSSGLSRSCQERQSAGPALDDHSESFIALRCLSLHQRHELDYFALLAIPFMAAYVHRGGLARPYSSSFPAGNDQRRSAVFLSGDVEPGSKRGGLAGEFLVSE